MNAKMLELRLRKLARLALNLILYRCYAPNEYVVLEDRNLIYLVNSKVACSSIKKAFISEEVKDDSDGKIHELLPFKTVLKLDLPNIENYAFTFVRNPFDRVVSCYVDKFLKEKERERAFNYFDGYMLGYLSNIDSFEDFVKKIVKIPNFLRDRHFKSQWSLISSSKIKINYIGRFENINDDFDHIKNKYSLYDLPHFNKSNAKDWRSFYTKESAKLVYDAYKDDFVNLDYNGDYKELQKFLK